MTDPADGKGDLIEWLAEPKWYRADKKQRGSFYT